MAYGLITILTGILTTLLVIILRSASDRHRRERGYRTRRRGRTR
jgi:hypothetical protein